MSCRWPLVVLWIALALLPLRGFANVVMHLPAQHNGTSGMPCHGAMAHPAAVAAAADPAVIAEVDGAGSSDACSMCDLCHGVSAVSSASPRAAVFLPPRVAAAEVLAAGELPRPSLRPPRG